MIGFVLILVKENNELQSMDLYLIIGSSIMVCPSVLGRILFLLYNDLHTCIKHSSTYHFADDTNLLNISSNYKTLTKEINKDLKCLVMWLTANTISLNNDKTELIYFHKAKNVIPSDNKIK